MRVVFDTNILLSAFLTQGGVAQQVFSKSVAAHAVLTSEYILHEATEKLSGKLKVPEREIASFMRFVRTRMTVINIPGKPGGIDFKDLGPHHLPL